MRGIIGEIGVALVAGDVIDIERAVAGRDTLLDVVAPDRVSILAGGRIVQTGGPELALRLEEEGYDAVMADA